MMKRVFLFLLTNFLVMLTVGTLIQMFGLGEMVSQFGTDYMGLALFCGLWGMVGAFISLGMSRWSAKRFMGVQLVEPTTTDPMLQWLVSTVHRQSSEAGLPVMPEVGIYPSDEVNAFATGPSRSRSLVAVSEGLLRRMSRDEAEGVLGHEVAHIANGDMVTMALLTGIVNALVMFLARVIAFAIDNAMRSGNNRGGGLGFMGRFVVIMVLQSVLMIFGSMVINAFSRHREYRADEGGAKLAGREKMIAALEALKRTFEVEDPQIAEVQKGVAAMKISSRGSRFARLLSSHPPLDSRLEALRNAG